MTDEIPEEIVAAVLARSGGACERCGHHMQKLDLHHRKSYARGGQDTVENLVALCGWGMQTGCHGWAHRFPPEHTYGFTLHSWQQPVDVPLDIEGSRVKLLPHDPWILNVPELTR